MELCDENRQQWMEIESGGQAQKAQMAVGCEQQKRLRVATQVRMRGGHRGGDGEEAVGGHSQKEGDKNIASMAHKGWVSPNGTSSSSLKSHASVTPTQEKGLASACTHARTHAHSLSLSVPISLSLFISNIVSHRSSYCVTFFSNVQCQSLLFQSYQTRRYITLIIRSLKQFSSNQQDL